MSPEKKLHLYSFFTFKNYIKDFFTIGSSLSFEYTTNYISYTKSGTSPIILHQLNVLQTFLSWRHSNVSKMIRYITAFTEI